MLCMCDDPNVEYCHFCRNTLRREAGLPDCICYIARMFTQRVPLIEIWLWKRTVTEHGVFPAVKLCFQVDDPMKLFQFAYVSAEVHAAIIDTMPDLFTERSNDEQTPFGMCMSHQQPENFTEILLLPSGEGSPGPVEWNESSHARELQQIYTSETRGFMIVMIADTQWITTQDAAESLHGNGVFANSDDADPDALFKVWRSPTELRPVGAPCEEEDQGGGRIPTDQSLV